MRKSVISKASGYSSILNGGNGNTDENIEILRISLKKEIDRKEKLEKLIEKYDMITSKEKTHIKSIKSSIIELKDLEAKSKTKFFLNPSIYVDNNVSKETREYLCMLLNTFYKKYEENSDCEQKTQILGKQMDELLSFISQNEEKLLKIEKDVIGKQVYLEGELLNQKSKLKDENNKMKGLEIENKRIAGICSEFEAKYTEQLNKVKELRDTCQNIERNIDDLKGQLTEGENIKKGKEEMMAGEMAYQQRFNLQLETLDSSIGEEKKRQKQLERQIKLQKMKVQKLKKERHSQSNKENQTFVNSDVVNHEVTMAIIDLKKSQRIEMRV